MQTAIDRVMQTFTLMANLSPEEARATRERLAQYLTGIDADERRLRLRGFAICADQAVLRGEEWRGKQHDG